MTESPKRSELYERLAKLDETLAKLEQERIAIVNEITGLRRPQERRPRPQLYVVPPPGRQ